MASYIIIKGLILKKEPREGLALNTSFQTKKNIWLHIVLGERNAGATPSKTCSEKKRKRFFVFFKKMPVFRIEHAGNHQIF